MKKKKYKCAFLDRDGVINEDRGYISKIQDFKIFAGTAEAIRLLNNHNYLVILITNQSGVGRRLISIKELNLIHLHLKRVIKKNGAIINDIFFCPYHPIYGHGIYKRNSKDRKPGSGMIKKAIQKWKINHKKSFMIGDKKSDLLSAKGARIKFYYKSKKNNLFDQIKSILKKN